MPWHIHNDWTVIFTVVPTVEDSRLDLDCPRVNMTEEEATEYCNHPITFAVENDLTTTDGGRHDHRADIEFARENIAMPISRWQTLYFRLNPDWTVTATDVPADEEGSVRGVEVITVIDGEMCATPPRHFAEGEVRYEWTLAEYIEYRENPIAFLSTGCGTHAAREPVAYPHEAIAEGANVLKLRFTDPHDMKWMSLVKDGEGESIAGQCPSSEPHGCWMDCHIERNPNKYRCPKCFSTDVVFVIDTVSTINPNLREDYHAEVVEGCHSLSSAECCDCEYEDRAAMEDSWMTSTE